MADTIIEVGAVIDLTQILPGLDALVAKTALTTSEMRASLEKLDAPVKIGQIAITPEQAGVNPAAMQAMTTVVTDLRIKEEKLKESVLEMREEVEKSGSSLGVRANWMARLTQEEQALALVQAVLENAEKALSEATGVLVGQQQLAMLIQQKLNEVTRDGTAAVQESIPATQAKAAALNTVNTATQTSTISTEANTGVEKQSTVAKEQSTVATKQSSVAKSQETVSKVQATAAEQAGLPAVSQSTALKAQEIVITQRLAAAESEYLAAFNRAAAAKVAVGTAAIGGDLTKAAAANREEQLAKEALTVAEKNLATAKAEAEAVAKKQNATIVETVARSQEERNILDALTAAQNERTAAQERYTAAHDKALGTPAANKEASAEAEKQETIALQQLEAAEAKVSTTEKDLVNFVAQKTSVITADTAVTRENAAAKAETVASTTQSTVATTANTTAVTDSTAANNNQVTSNEAVATSATEAASSVTTSATANTTAASSTDVLTASAKDLAAGLRAQGYSADEAAKIMLQSGISAGAVKAAFDSMKQSISAVQGQVQSTVSGFQTLINQQKAAGASANDFAATLRLTGISAKEMITQMQAAGFTVEEIAVAFAGLGIKSSVTRNEILKLAVAANATREQLVKLTEALDAAKVQTTGLGVVMNQGRVIGGAFDGSLGMMTSGLVRVLAATKALQPAIQAIFPLFAAFAVVDILKGVAEGFMKLIDNVQGYTDAVKKAEQENVKFSQEAELHAGSVVAAYERINETLREQAQLETEGMYAQARRGVAAEENMRGQFRQLIAQLPVLQSIQDAYDIIKGSIDGVGEATRRAAEDVDRLGKKHAELIRNLEEQTKHQEKMLQMDIQVSSIGKTKIEQLELEMETLRKKQALEKQGEDNRISRQIVEGKEGPEAKPRVMAELEEKQQKEVIEILKKYGIATLEERLAVESAVADGEKAAGSARVAQRQKLAEELYVAGKIDLEKEMSELRAATDQKYQIDLDYLVKKRARAIEARAAGKEEGPTVASTNAEIRALTTAHETAITANKNAEIEKRRRLDEEYANTVIAGETRIANEEITFRKESAKNAFEATRITESEYTSILVGEENKRSSVVLEELKKRRANVLLYSNPDEQKAKNKEIDDEEEVEKKRHAVNLEDIAFASQRRVNEVERKNVENSLNEFNKATEAKVRGIEQAADREISVTDNLQSLGLINYRERISRTEAIIDAEKKATVAQLEEAIAAEQATKSTLIGLQAQEAAQKKIVELENQRTKVIEQEDEKRKKLETDLANHLVQVNQQAYNVISHSFTSAFDKMLTEHTTFKNVMIAFWNDQVQGWARMGLQILAHYVQTLAQIVIQHALSLLKIQVLDAGHLTFKKATQDLWEALEDAFGIKRVAKTVTQDSAEAAAEKASLAARVTATTTAELAKTAVVTTQVGLRTAAETGSLPIIAAAEAAARTAESAATSAKDVAEVISLAAVAAAGAAAAAAPAGPAAMAAAAAGAESIVLAFVPQAAVVAEKGAFIDKDTPAFLHKNETVLPPKLSLGFQNIINAGAFGGVNIPPTLVTPAGPVPEGKVNVTHQHNNRIVNSKPVINISVNGQQHPQLTQRDIEDAVMNGIRSGGIRANV